MENKRVVRNAAWIIGCRIVQAMLSLLVTMISARCLGPSGFGLISYAASIVTFAVPVMQLGLTSTLVQEIINAPEQEGKLLGTAVTMSFVSSLFCIAGVIAFAMAANAGEPATVLVCGLYSIQLIFQSIDIVRCWFQAKLLSKYVSVTVLAGYILTSVYKIVLLATGCSIYWFALAQTVDYCVISLTLVAIYRRVGTQRFGFSWALAKQMFAKSKYYIISGMMVTIFAQTDRIMLKLMLDEAAVGYYSAAASCAGMTCFVFAAILDSFRPAILEKKKQGAGFEKSVAGLYSIIIHLSLAQCAVLTVFAGLAVRLIYGGDYAPAVSALRIIVWYTTFSYLGSVRNIWILAEGHQKYLWIINLSGAAANVALNAWLIPIMGINGAALASLVTQFFTNVLIGFIIPPIRRNNDLMLRGLDPRLAVGMFRSR